MIPHCAHDDADVIDGFEWGKKMRSDSTVSIFSRFRLGSFFFVGMCRERTRQTGRDDWLSMPEKIDRAELVYRQLTRNGNSLFSYNQAHSITRRTRMMFR